MLYGGQIKDIDSLGRGLMRKVKHRPTIVPRTHMHNLSLGEKHHRLIRRNMDKVHRSCIFLLYVALLSVFLVMVEIELYLKCLETTSSCLMKTTQSFTSCYAMHQADKSIGLNIVRILLVLLSIFAAGSCIYYYQSRLSHLKFVKIVPTCATIWNSHLKYPLRRDLLICMIFPLPFNEYLMGDHSLHLMCSVGVFCRLAFISHYFYHSNRSAELTDISFMIKRVITNYSAVFAAASFLFMNAFLAYIYHFIDHAQTHQVYWDHHEQRGAGESGDHLPSTLSRMDALWFILASLTTIGYGDISPTHYTGRAFVSASGAIGIFLSAILFSLSVRFFICSGRELRINYFFSRYRLMRERQHACASLIQQSWQHRQSYVVSTRWIKSTKVGGLAYRSLRERRILQAQQIDTINVLKQIKKNSQRTSTDVEAVISKDLILDNSILTLQQIGDDLKTMLESKRSARSERNARAQQELETIIPQQCLSRIQLHLNQMQRTMREMDTVISKVDDAVIEP